MPGAAAALDIRDLTVRYPGGSRDALRDVSVQLSAGSFLAVGGPNGAGKSTLCLAAAGLLPRVIHARTRGSVVVGGVLATADGRAGGPVAAGIVLADPATGLTGARATVREELAFGLENVGVERTAMDARIADALATLGIEHLADAAPEALSGGEQQRVAIAAAVAMRPPVLVLDEAAAELDPAAALALADLLPRLAAAGMAVLAADHAIEILSAADRVLLLDDGTVAAIGDRQAEALAHATRQPPGPSVAWDPGHGRPAPGVSVEGLRFRYPSGVEALRGVSLEVEPGSAVAIVGGNGSGKSTLARHLVGLLRPAAGAVRVDGRDLAGEPVERVARTVGFLFQDPRDQLFGRTVEAAVAFGPRNLGLPPARVISLVDGALGVLGLVDRRGENPHDLDLAARKQVALAGVLAMDPALLVLDEPTTGQDRPGLARVEATLQALRRAGRTIVAVTHDLGLAARSFDRVVVLRAGELADDGPPSRVLGVDNAGLLASTGLRPAVPR